MNASEYVKYQAAVQRGLARLKHVSTGACAGCADCGLDNEATDEQRELAEEPSFSWSACDCCGSKLGGNRHPAHGMMKREGCTEADLLVHMDVCEDCLYFINYGQMDDMSMMEIEASEQR